MKEKIAAAAVRIGERIFTGATHFDATKKLMSAAGLDAEEKARMMLAGEAGFVTDAGRFISAEEGYSVAREAQQLRNDISSYSGTKLMADHLDSYGRLPVDGRIF